MEKLRKSKEAPAVALIARKGKQARFFQSTVWRICLERIVAKSEAEAVEQL